METTFQQHLGSNHILDESVVEIIAKCLPFQILVINHALQQVPLLPEVMFGTPAFLNFNEETVPGTDGLDGHGRDLFS